MEKNRIIEKSIEKVKEFHNADKTGHDFSHVMRVYRNALKLHETEGGDIFIIQMAALFHDYIDYKLGDEASQTREVVTFLKNNNVDENSVNRIIHAMRAVSFKGGNNPYAATSIEDKIVQDADRLDSLGAIGIARTFIYGGNKNHVMYDPSISPRNRMSIDEYKSDDNTIINHFYEKILKLHDLMLTKTGKTIARERHAFVNLFLEQLMDEISHTNEQ